MSPQPAPRTFKEFVAFVVLDEWARTQKPLLLSRIGQKAVESGYALEASLGGRKMAQFIDQELKDRLQVEPIEGSSTLLRVRPRTPETAVLSAAAEPPSPKFAKGLWLAFSRPIPEGQERRIQLEPKVRYWDETPPAAEIAGRFPITEAHIAKPIGEDFSAAARNEAILLNIQRWMQEHGLDIAKFEDAGPRPTLKLSPQNPLTLLIASLDEGELKRVSLPLDVIAKLLKQ